MTRRLPAWILLWATAAALAVAMTWPLASKLDGLGRTDSGDGNHSIWNVGWVAHAIVDRPHALFDANIFYPHHNTLAYSEANVVAGVLAVPAYWLTRDAVLATNVVILLAFTLSVVCAFGLARYLTGCPHAAMVAALCFAFCPFIFARLPHIQLQFIAGIPLCLLAMHRLVDHPTLARAVLLGLSLAVQALACAYYGIFAGLTVGYGVLFYAVSRGHWRRPPYWGVVAVAAVVAVAPVLPFFMPYLDVREAGFVRPIADAVTWAANWKAYFASSAHAHRWMLALMVEGWNEVLFPGLVVTVLGLAGAWFGLRAPAPTSADAGAHSNTSTARNGRETTVFYLSVGVLAGWASFGPKAGLYSVMYYTLPVMTFLRAPARTGIMVVVMLTVLSALALARLWREWPAGRRTLAAGILGGVTLLELTNVPVPWRPVPPTPPIYDVLARLPAAPVAEFPFFHERYDFPRHTTYMLWSTRHWRPLVNGYSDHFPADFRRIALPLASFPTRASFSILRERRVRYVTFHRNLYDRRSLEKLDDQIELYSVHLRPLLTQGDVWLYEIRSFPEEPES